MVDKILLKKLMNQANIKYNYGLGNIKKIPKKPKKKGKKGRDKKFPDPYSLTILIKKETKEAIENLKKERKCKSMSEFVRTAIENELKKHTETKED